MAEDCEPGLVSVVIPTYNRSGLLQDAIESVARQTYRPIELLVVDDGSTDDTDAVLADARRRFGDDHAFRFRILAQQHAGAPAARNLGLIESRGEFIQFLDSDDLLAPEKLAVCTRALGDAPGVDYVFTGRVFVPASRTKEFLQAQQDIPVSVPPPVGVRAGDMAGIPAQAVLGFLRRNLCRKIGPWNESLVRHQDWEYTTRIVAVSREALKISSPLYVIRTHNSGRIDDLRKSPTKALDARLASALAAEQRALISIQDAEPTRAFRRRLTSRYLKILRQSIKAVSVRHLASASQGLKRSLQR